MSTYHDDSFDYFVDRMTTVCDLEHDLIDDLILFYVERLDFHLLENTRVAGDEVRLLKVCHPRNMGAQLLFHWHRLAVFRPFSVEVDHIDRTRSETV